MRITLYSYPSLHINRGGPSYKTEMIYNHLQKKGIDVRLFNMWQEYNWRKDDIFYVFTANAATWPLTVNLETAGIRYVVNPIFFSNHKPATIKLYRALEKPLRKIFIRSYSDYDFTEKVCSAAEMILPNTEAESALLQKSFSLPGEKFHTIPNGVEERFASANPDLFYKKYGLKDFVLYTGHLGPFRKNGLKIIKALQKIDAPSVIIADILHNKEGELCRQELEKTPKIKYLGWLQHNDALLASAYAACHTFILPTRYETPGRAALEAGLAGANIVITPRGGTKEYFREFALYPNPDSVNDIAATIRKSLNTAKSPSLKKRIIEKYVWEVIADETLSLFKRII